MSLSYEDHYLLFLERHIILVALQSLNMWFGHQCIHSDPVFLKEMLSARVFVISFSVMFIFGATLQTKVNNPLDRLIIYLSFSLISGFTNALLFLNYDISAIYNAIIMSFGICFFFVVFSLTNISSPFSRWIKLRFNQKIENPTLSTAH